MKPVTAGFSVAGAAHYQTVGHATFSYNAAGAVTSRAAGNQTNDGLHMFKTVPHWQERSRHYAGHTLPRSCATKIR